MAKSIPIWTEGQWPNNICSGDIRYEKGQFSDFYLADANHGLPIIAYLQDRPKEGGSHVRACNYPEQTEAIANQLTERWNQHPALLMMIRELFDTNMTDEELASFARKRYEDLYTYNVQKDWSEKDREVTSPPEALVKSTVRSVPKMKAVQRTYEVERPYATVGSGPYPEAWFPWTDKGRPNLGANEVIRVRCNNGVYSNDTTIEREGWGNKGDWGVAEIGVKLSQIETIQRMEALSGYMVPPVDKRRKFDNMFIDKEKRGNLLVHIAWFPWDRYEPPIGLGMCEISVGTRAAQRITRKLVTEINWEGRGDAQIIHIGVPTSNKVAIARMTELTNYHLPEGTK